MKLDPAQLRTLSGLLDEALDLSETERRHWLDALGQEFASVKPLLETMLARRDSVETGDLIDTLPQFDLADDGIDRGSDFVAGAVVGPYRLLRELGRGGMGEVWLAERSDGLVRRPVALKLPAIAGARRTLVERFTRECEILAPLTHPHIARLYDVGFTAEGQPFLALEYVEGATITAYCDEQRLDLRARVGLFLQVLEAVQYAHSNLILHRDLKPSNILVTPAGEVKLLDFGIAKLMTDGSAQETELTQLGGRALTLDYASPEQVLGTPLTTASDVYSLGVVLYELLCGERPYRLKRGTRAELEDAILAADVTRPSSAVAREQDAQCRGGSIRHVSRAITGDLDTITLKALQRRPDRRYPTASALVDDLQRYLDGRVVLAQPENRWYRAKKWLLRNKLVTGAAAAVLLSLLAGMGATLWQASLAREQARVAQHEAKASDAVASFMIGLFKPNDLRANAPGSARQLTADQLLDIGYERSKTELKDAPEIRARLLYDLSEIYTGLDQWDKAIAIAKERAALLQATSSDPVVIANAYMSVAQPLMALDRRDEADANLQAGLKAIAGLETERARRERGNIYELMGVLFYGRDPDLSMRYYQQAVDLLSEHPVFEDELPGALAGLAIARTQRGDLAGGFAAVDAMRAERVKRWGADSMMVDHVDKLKSGLLVMTGQVKAAEALNLANIASLRRKLTPLDFQLLDALSLRGRILVMEERYPEAIQSVQESLVLIRSKGVEEGPVTSSLMMSLPAALLGQGDAAQAAKAAAEALAYLEAHEPDTDSRDVIRTLDARLLTLAGRFDEARDVLTKVHERSDAHRSPFESHIPARIDVLLASVAIEQGRFEEAGRWLDEAERVLAPTTPWLGCTQDLIASRRARMALDQGRFKEALDLARTTLERQTQRTEPNNQRELQADLEGLAGRALLQLEDASEALKHLNRARELRNGNANPNSLWVAEVDVHLARAEAASGQQSSARARMARAEVVLARQAPYTALLAPALTRTKVELAAR